MEVSFERTNLTFVVEDWDEHVRSRSTTTEFPLQVIHLGHARQREEESPGYTMINAQQDKRKLISI